MHSGRSVERTRTVVNLAEINNMKHQSILPPNPNPTNRLQRIRALCYEARIGASGISQEPCNVTLVVHYGYATPRPLVNL
jgi:hypothetical protein